MVNVFDISQTGGEPIPELVTELEGTSLDAEALIKTIEEVAMIPIEYIEPENDGSLLNGAKGYYSPSADRIVINANLSTIQKAKTLTHEYAHSCLHKKTELSTDAREIEAEALAFVICDHFNIDTSDYSFPYIASYANKDIEFLKETLVHIQQNAHEYISNFEPIFERYLNQLKINSKYMTPLELETFSSSFILELKDKMDIDTVTGFINAIDAEPEYIIDTIREMVNDHVGDLETKYPGQCYLYERDAKYQKNINESLYQTLSNEKHPSRPFIENSIEHQNYEKFIKIAAPILNDDVTYMKYSCPSHLDFNVEKVLDDRIAISHYYELNGDLMADPDIELTLDKENELLIPHTYQLDSFGIYQTDESNPKLSDELKEFIETWLNNIAESGYRLTEIHSDGFCYDNKNNLKELQSYCKENGIANMMPKRKELER